MGGRSYHSRCDRFHEGRTGLMLSPFVISFHLLYLLHNEYRWRRKMLHVERFGHSRWVSKSSITLYHCKFISWLWSPQWNCVPPVYVGALVIVSVYPMNQSGKTPIVLRRTFLDTGGDAESSNPVEKKILLTWYVLICCIHCLLTATVFGNQSKTSAT